MKGPDRAPGGGGRGLPVAKPSPRRNHARAETGTKLPASPSSSVTKPACFASSFDCIPAAPQFTQSVSGVAGIAEDPTEVLVAVEVG